MNNAFTTELYKIKNNKMALIGLLSVLSIPLLLLLKIVFLDKTRIEFQEWAQIVTMLIGILVPVMSGFFITQSVQKEYGERTLINMLTAPVNRAVFILSKIGAWFCWYLAVLLCAVLLVIGVSGCLFYTELTANNLLKLVLLLLQTNLLSFISLLPVLFVAVKQRTLFYPSILITLLFTVLQAVGNQVSEELIPIASCVPWLAVSLTQVLPYESLYFYICLFSITLFGILAVILTVHTFKKQDL